MLAAIGVSSVEELFRDIPAGVRFQGELDLEPALSEPELVRHLEELAAKTLPENYRLAWSGQSYQEKTSTQNTAGSFGLGHIMVSCS